MVVSSVGTYLPPGAVVEGFFTLKPKVWKSAVTFLRQVRPGDRVTEGAARSTLMDKNTTRSNSPAFLPWDRPIQCYVFHNLL